ncbi:hypothetical protein MKZ38_005793 [Zalerion maritima]|uniref:Uncharacterized protein n=1 Tax=Zalerion maritima TaxID=339359 RepID=A0AAD5RXH2_9PEZI|nr:hypothetical protein MKZ38_005793 [Zalerion maritima]
MPSPTALTIYVFGISSLAAGIVNLINPSSALSTFSLPFEALPAVNGNSLAAIAMGIYYPLLAYQENRAFFMFTIPMRCLTATVFVRQGGNWKIAGLWEGGGAVLTMLALVWEAWSAAAVGKHGNAEWKGNKRDD